jgi:hypothetical protein
MNQTTPLNTVLLANIGNRNISFQGKPYDKLSEEQKAHFGGTFKAFTQTVLSEFEHFSADLSCNIINQILEALGVDFFDHVILFGSDQLTDNPSKTDQDTLWAAQILAKLLVKQGFLTENQVKVYPVKCDISDNDGLLRYYREQIKRINRDYMYPNVSICDAGGSPQQKVALKIMAEFMVDSQQLEVLYVNAKNKAVEKVSQIEYRNIITAEQVRSLTSKGQYKAALSLRQVEDVNTISTTKSLANRLVGLGYFLSIGNYEMYQKTLRGMKSKERERFSFLQESPNDIQSTLTKAQFLNRAGQYDSAILSFAVFYEKYLSQSIAEHLQYDLVNSTQYHREIKRLKKEAFEKFENVKLKFEPDNIPDIAFKVTVAQNIEGEAHQTFVNALANFIGGNPENDNPKFIAINTVRNKIAHEGFIPDDVFMKKQLSYFSELIGAAAQLTQLPAENVFELLNETISREL